MAIILPTPLQRSYVKRIICKPSRPLMEVLSTNVVIVMALYCCVAA